MAIFPKFSIKKIFLLILLVMVSLVLSAVKLISGGKTTSQAQAQCWTPPGGGESCVSGCEGYEGAGEGGESGACGESCDCEGAVGF